MRILVAALWLSGCVVSEKYVVSAESVKALAARPASERVGIAVPATREGKNVFVRAETIDLSATEAATATATATATQVKARARSRMVIAGQALTWIGTGISLAGTVLFFGFDGGVKHWAGGGLALSAESIMWTGTGLWIAGQRSHPQEISAGRPGVQYLSP